MRLGTGEPIGGEPEPRPWKKEHRFAGQSSAPPSEIVCWDWIRSRTPKASSTSNNVVSLPRIILFLPPCHYLRGVLDGVRGETCCFPRGMGRMDSCAAEHRAQVVRAVPVCGRNSDQMHAAARGPRFGSEAFVLNMHFVSLHTRHKYTNTDSTANAWRRPWPGKAPLHGRFKVKRFSHVKINLLQA